MRDDALLSHVRLYAGVYADLYNEDNKTDLTQEQLETRWEGLARCSNEQESEPDPALSEAGSAKAASILEGERAPIQKSELVVSEEVRINRYHSNIRKCLKPSYHYSSLGSFLSFCELEYEVFKQCDEIPSTTLAIVHSLKTVVLCTHKQFALKVYSSNSTESNAVVFYDENQFWLANCGFDGQQSEYLGVEVNGVGLRNGERVLLDGRVLIRVAGQPFLWRRIE